MIYLDRQSDAQLQPNQGDTLQPNLQSNVPLGITATKNPDGSGDISSDEETEQNLQHGAHKALDNTFDYLRSKIDAGEPFLLIRYVQWAKNIKKVPNSGQSSAFHSSYKKHGTT